MEMAQLIAGVLAVYSAFGLLFGVWFVAFAVGRFDPAARKTGLAFRALILPGAAALWPALLLAWRRRRAAGVGA